MAARERLLDLNRKALSAPKLLLVVINQTVSGVSYNREILSEASCTNPNFIFTGKKNTLTNDNLPFNFPRYK